MIKFSGAYNSTIDFYVCVRTFSSVQSSTGFQRFPRLTAQLFADARNGKTQNFTDPRKFSVSCIVIACGDRPVILAPLLVSNEASNLAECYMSMRCNFDEVNNTIVYKVVLSNTGATRQVCNFSMTHSGPFPLTRDNRISPWVSDDCLHEVMGKAVGDGSHMKAVRTVQIAT